MSDAVAVHTKPKIRFVIDTLIFLILDFSHSGCQVPHSYLKVFHTSATAENMLCDSPEPVIIFTADTIRVQKHQVSRSFLEFNPLLLFVCLICIK